MEQLQHFIHHEHPLTLFNEDNGNNSRGKICMACEKPILMGPSLSCTQCDTGTVFLHKTCGELPLEMNYFGDPDHLLRLFHVVNGDRIFPHSHFHCDACDQPARSPFGYYCNGTDTTFSCHFRLEAGCAQLAQTIEHSSLHQHPLTLYLKPCSFCCDACGIKHEEPGLPYICYSCNFWVQSDCVSLPSRIERTSHHHHPLTLVSPWNKLEIYKFEMYCDICSKEVGEKNCIYYCAECTHFAHIQCAISISPADTKSHQDPGAEDHPQLPTQIIYLSVPDESCSRDLANSLIEKISLLRASEVGRGLKEGHCNHNLTLLDAQTNEVCDACVRPISTRYYNCSECHLNLHKSCAELPSEIQHPFHTLHPLILRKMSFFECDACGRDCNGFSYSCWTGGCDFDLDINCASLPTTIRHEAHEHPLNLINDDCHEWCSCCRSDCSDLYKFRCRNCKFNLHIQCASLPQTIRHKYDRCHALILKYNPIGIKPEEYYCEICEKEMNMKLWFYYCADCNYAFHSKCVCTAANKYKILKPGTIVNVKNHPHPLTLARKANYKLSCDVCRLPFRNFAIGKFVFECKECEFIVHFHCGIWLKKQGI